MSLLNIFTINVVPGMNRMPDYNRQNDTLHSASSTA
jgi:hypothetical protein